ncbi:hypothetical protein AK812_SmicGene44163 [Symbiodinium microadriaticum]|uniref:Uncharacterized protein n=1 Tax=Symbiodinium microadriaticum TaxID=2951 RepID=A0A1Q9BZ63_SYMMI|nr:hypothetical protein AK812_SmicGene44163 [Symbiodinium microadriaticum]CAE7948306.1 unnamed protein product [Symbiodinium sp. KB8]
MPTPPQDEEPLRDDPRQDVREPRPGGASAVMPRRTASPRAAADGGASAGKRFVDYKMEAAPSWDGEQPEVKYKEYARQRIIDAIQYGSRYLKDAKLEQAFDQASCKGRRRMDQSLSGFVATKKAAEAARRSGKLLDQLLDEVDAVEYIGDYLTCVFYEAKDRLSKGKGRRTKERASLPGKSKGEGEASGHELVARLLRCGLLRCAFAQPPWPDNNHNKPRAPARPQGYVFACRRMWLSGSPKFGETKVAQLVHGPPLRSWMPRAALSLRLQHWRRLWLCWLWAFSAQAASALLEMVREPDLRVARRLAIGRERMEQRAMLLQQQENFILAKTNAEKQEPTRNYLPDDAGHLLRPRVQHVGRSKFLAPVLRSSPTCQHVRVSHGANAQWAWAKCEQCGSVEQIPKLTPAKKLEKQKKKEPGDGPSGATEELAGTTTLQQAANEPPVLVPSRSSGPMVLDTKKALFIGVPASSAQPPESSALGLEDDLLEDTLNIRCDPPAERRGCTSDLTLYRLHEHQLLIWVCLRGDPACKYNWKGRIPHEQMSAAFGAKLCLECQQNELKKVIWKGREACTCNQCGDRTLASEWWEVYNELLSQGGYDPLNLVYRLENFTPVAR